MNSFFTLDLNISPAWHPEHQSGLEDFFNLEFRRSSPDLSALKRQVPQLSPLRWLQHLGSLVLFL